jgi:hypothetical protein
LAGVIARFRGPNAPIALPRLLRFAVLALVALAGCASAPRRPIPTDRALFEGRSYSFGHEVFERGRLCEVLEISRAGLREDASLFLYFENLAGERSLSVEVLEAGRLVPREPQIHELEEAARLLSDRNPAFARGLGAWIGKRMDLPGLAAALRAEVEARRSSRQSLIDDLAEAYRDERAAAELREREEPPANTFFAGLFGWRRGAFSGYSWSFPFHLERYDETDETREVVLFPILSGGRRQHGGVEMVSVPLLAYYGRVATPIDRSEGLFVLGFGSVLKRSIAGETRTTFALPLLALRERSTGEDVAADQGRIVAGERTETHLLASLIRVTSEKPGVYRDRGALKTVGRTRSSWRVLPLVSHKRDEHGSETVIWPLLGFGVGSEDGRWYVRLLYFLKL